MNYPVNTPPPAGPSSSKPKQAYPNPFENEMARFQHGPKTRWNQGEGMTASQVPLHSTAFRGISAAQPWIRSQVPALYGEINDLLGRQGAMDPGRQQQLAAFRGAASGSPMAASWAGQTGGMAPGHQQALQQARTSQAVQSRAQMSGAADARRRADLAALFPMLSGPVLNAYNTGGAMQQRRQQMEDAQGDRKKQMYAQLLATAANLFAPGAGSAGLAAYNAGSGGSQ